MTVFYPNCMIYVIHMITCSKKNCYPYINPYCSVCSFTSQFIWFDDDSVYTVSVKSLLQFIYFCIFRSMIHLNPSVCNMTIACLVNRFHVNEFKLRLYNVHDQNPDLWRKKVRSRLEGCRFSFEIFTPSKNNRYYRMLDWKLFILMLMFILFFNSSFNEQTKSFWFLMQEKVGKC